MPQNATNEIEKDDSRLEILGGLFFATADVLRMVEIGLISKDAAAKYLKIPSKARP